MERDFKDMLSAFSDEAVEYLLVGAHAMAVHGCRRATQDIEVGTIGGQSPLLQRDTASFQEFQDTLLEPRTELLAAIENYH